MTNCNQHSDEWKDVVYLLEDDSLDDATFYTTAEEQLLNVLNAIAIAARDYEMDTESFAYKLLRERTSQP